MRFVKLQKTENLHKIAQKTDFFTKNQSKS